MKKLNIYNDISNLTNLLIDLKKESNINNQVKILDFIEKMKNYGYKFAEKYHTLGVNNNIIIYPIRKVILEKIKNPVIRNIIENSIIITIKKDTINITFKNQISEKKIICELTLEVDVNNNKINDNVNYIKVNYHNINTLNESNKINMSINEIKQHLGFIPKEEKIKTLYEFEQLIKDNYIELDDEFKIFDYVIKDFLENDIKKTNTIKVKNGK